MTYDRAVAMQWHQLNGTNLLYVHHNLQAVQ